MELRLAHRQRALRLRLLQTVLAALSAVALYSAGHWQGVRDSAGSGHVGGGGGGSGALAAGNCAAPQADFCYDVVAYNANKPAVKRADAFPPPRRRPGYVRPESTNQALYDGVWVNRTYQKASCWGCRFAADVVAKLQFDTVLDAGTGNGQIVRVMRVRGKAAWGIELSQAVLEQDASDLLRAGLVEQGSLTSLPYADRQFDLVFSADVLEHIPPEDADAVVAELVRVAKRHIVLSISLKSHNAEALHTLLRPRRWWEAKFAAHGAVPNRALVWALQDKETRFSRARGDFKQCRMEGSETDGGHYEVCLVQQTWLVGRPGQEVRPYRCITPANGEMEPWMFAFTVGGGDGHG